MVVKMKVFGGLMHGRGESHVRTVIAATSQKVACAALNRISRMSLYEFRRYWSDTRSEIEVVVALSEPGAIFQASDTIKDDFVKIAGRLQ